MKVAQVMTKDVRMTSPDQTIREAARTMSEEDVGVLPVAENDQLVGMITDRDIAIRAVAEGKGPEAKVRQVMTDQVKYCFEDEELDHVAKNMANIQMRRLPVMNRDKRLVGIVAHPQSKTKAAITPVFMACAARPRSNADVTHCVRHRATLAAPVCLVPSPSRDRPARRRAASWRRKAAPISFPLAPRLRVAERRAPPPSPIAKLRSSVRLRVNVPSS
jgi:predicted transcriptional regulator